MKPTPTEVLRRTTLPSRAAQLTYHRALEEALHIKIVRVCGKWSIVPSQKKNS